MIAICPGDIVSWFAGLNDVCRLLLITATITGIACFVAYKQLRSLSKTSKESFLLNIDKKYDDIYLGREAVHELVKRIENEMIAKNSKVDEDKLISRITGEMQQMEQEATDEYSLIKQVIDFYEFIGYLMISKYLKTKEVKALYVPALLDWGKWFVPYILKRQEREGKELYKYVILAYKKLDGHITPADKEQ